MNTATGAFGGEEEEKGEGGDLCFFFFLVAFQDVGGV